MQSSAKSIMAVAAVAGALALVAPVKESEAGTCPQPPVAGSRVFTVDSGSCLASAPGNLSGNNDAINQLGFITLDKSDDGTTGALEGILNFNPPTSGLSGTWSFTPNAMYTSYVLALKSGEGTLNPDWAAFLVDGTSGTWSISGSQELSHANLYARVVPVPAALPLMLGALAGLGLIARRRADT